MIGRPGRYVVRLLDVATGRPVRSRFDRPLTSRFVGAVPLTIATSDGSAEDRTPDLSALLAAGVRAGFGAAVVMDLPMALQRDGYTPAYIAAGVLRGRDPVDVSRVDAILAHHGAGALGGVLFALVYDVLDGVSTPESETDGLSTPAYPIAVGFVVVFIYVFFARFVLPRFGGDARDRAGVVRRAWLVSTLVYGAVLAALVLRSLASED